MEILSPEDRVILWRQAVDAEGNQRSALLHALSNDIFSAMGALSLYSEEYARLAVESIETLDDAGLFARDDMRIALEGLYDETTGVAALAAQVAALLRDAAGVAHLGAERRVRAMAMASEWREHILERERAEPEFLSVADVAARFGVTTQAVYKWLQKERIEGTQGPGGSWRIPLAQFERDDRPRRSREELDASKVEIIAARGDEQFPDESWVTENMRDQGESR